MRGPSTAECDFLPPWKPAGPVGKTLTLAPIVGRVSECKPRRAKSQHFLAHCVTVMLDCVIALAAVVAMAHVPWPLAAAESSGLRTQPSSCSDERLLPLEGKDASLATSPLKIRKGGTDASVESGGRSPAWVGRRGKRIRNQFRCGVAAGSGRKGLRCNGIFTESDGAQPSGSRYE
jgi:hypothetical protein